VRCCHISKVLPKADYALLELPRGRVRTVIQQPIAMLYNLLESGLALEISPNVFIN
jgi:hypothetical protein